MIQSFLEPHTAPFAVALGLMFLIALLEAVSLAFGAALSGLIDTFLPDFDAPDLDLEDIPGADGASTGFLTEFLGWLSFGRVPALMLLIAFLTSFGLGGFLIQGVVSTVIGTALPSLMAVIPAFLLALPATRYTGIALSRVMPKEETEAVSRESFIGKIAVVTTGTAQRGLPAQAKLKDEFGMTHYILVEPDIDGETFAQGSEVLVVRSNGPAFRVIANVHQSLSP